MPSHPEITCPVCQSVTAVTGDGLCQVCGAWLEDEPAPQPALTDDQTDITPIPSSPSGEMRREKDELLRAFRSQFEESRTEVPVGWVRRLEHLARETEDSRRLATLIFVDLRGYTRLSNVLDEAELEELRNWFCGLCARAVERHGGFIIQFLGDAAFAAFGAPWAFERDAESALRCLLEIREHVENKGSFQGESLAIRAGAASGVVNVRLVRESGRSRPDLFGPPVNLAARLEAHAETGEILISDTLARQISGAFELERREPWIPKNYGREVTPYAVVAWRREADPRRRHDLPFVGRTEEREHLLDVFRRVVEGEFRALRILGEAGIGKSRLLSETVSSLAPEWDRRVLRVFLVPEDRHVLLSPFLEALRALHPGSDADVYTYLSSPEVGLDPAVLPPLGYLFRCEPHLSNLRSLPAEMLREQVTMSLVAVLTHLASRAPLVLAIDDTHFRDRLSGRVLVELKRRSPPGLGIILVERPESVYREEYEGEAPEDELEDWESFTLPPLSVEDRRTLLSRITDIDTLHPLLRRRLLDETEGVPLYLIEMAVGIEEAAHERHAHSPLPDDLQEALSLHDEHSPSVLADLLQARIDRLSANRRALLQAAAIIGHRFSYALLDGFADIEAELLDELFALRGMHLVRDEPIPEDLRFLFTPSIVRDLAYQMLTDAQRERLHGLLAQRIEERFPQRRNDFVTELAYHWVHSAEPKRAQPYLRASVLGALAIGAWHDAYQIATRALARLENRGGEDSGGLERTQTVQIALLQELSSRAARAQGRFDRAMAHARAWLTIAEGFRNAVWITNARHQIAICHFEKGELQEAEELLRSILRDDADAPAQRLDPVHKTLAGIDFRRGRFAEAIQTLRGVAARGEDGSVPLARLHGDAMGTCGLCHWKLGELKEALECHQRAADIYDRLGLIAGQAIALNNSAIVQEKLGRLREAEATYSRATEIAEKIGYLHMISAIEANRSLLNLWLRRFEEARRQAARSLHFARMIAHGNSEAIALANLALANDGLGFSDEARPLVAEAVAKCERMDDRSLLCEVLLEACWIAARAGDMEEARAVLARVAKEELAGETAAWRDTLTALMSGLENGKAPELFAAEEIRRFGKSADRVSAVRRIDAAEWLRQHRQSGIGGGEMAALRAALLE